MKELLSWYSNPFTYIYPFDRNRREYTKYFGEYKPTLIKRFVCFFLDEKLYPIDWEEVPPFLEEIGSSSDVNFPLKTNAKIAYYECYTQPDMISQNNIYVRRILLGLGFLGFNELLMRKPHFFKGSFISYMFYDRQSFKRVALLCWFYYMACVLLVNKNYQKPYN
jgi:hypothetical protein